MYENLSGIELRRDIFYEKTKEFEFFPISETEKNISKMCLVYGRNGSGKSTLARGFLDLKKEELEERRDVRLLDMNKKTIPWSNTFAENIYVFNEDFIEKNVKLKENGLDTIIMFGEQVNIDQHIENIEKEIKELQERYTKIEGEYLILEEKTNVNNPFYYKNRMIENLKGDDNWAGKDKELKDNKTNSAVNDKILNDIMLQNPTKSEKNIKEEFDEKLEGLRRLINTDKPIDEKILLPKNIVEEDKIYLLLEKKIEKPKVSERDKLIMELVLSGEQEHFHNVHNYFLESKAEKCPYCLQEVSKKYREDLISSIEKVLNREIEKHKDELEKSKIIKMEFDFSLYEQLDNELISECKNKLEELNIVIDSINSLIDKKIENCYRPVLKNEGIFNYKRSLEEFNNKLDELEKERIKHNEKFNYIKELKQELLKLNNEIAYYAISSDYKLYLEKLKYKNEIKVKLEDVKNEEKILNGKLLRLRGEKRNVHIAVDFINAGLKYVFFSNDRLKIESDGTQYKLFSNNRPVKPYDISCGERNILAMCYYFASIMNNMNHNEMYEKEVLLVIDDPVSSFDLENKIGILSYMKSQLLKVFMGNSNSRVIIFSHDIQIILDFQKQFSEIKDAIKAENCHDQSVSTCMELERFSMEKNNPKKRNEYTNLLEMIYNYATNDGQSSGFEQEDLIIGNVMRRVLETFSTFEYKKGIDKISCDKEILESMGEEKYREYFENLMYRLVLHGESHMEDRVKSIIDINFYDFISVEEKKRTARDVLCLIYVLNKNHLSAHLDTAKKSIKPIESWCKDILEEKTR